MPKYRQLPNLKQCTAHCAPRTHLLHIRPAASFLKWPVISRPLKGEGSTIDLVVGYHEAKHAIYRVPNRTPAKVHLEWMSRGPAQSHCRPR
jgi:hypothetical protein